MYLNAQFVLYIKKKKVDVFVLFCFWIKCRTSLRGWCWVLFAYCCKPYKNTLKTLFPTEITITYELVRAVKICCLYYACISSSWVLYSICVIGRCILGDTANLFFFTENWMTMSANLQNSKCHLKGAKGKEGKYTLKLKNSNNKKGYFNNFQNIDFHDCIVLWLNFIPREGGERK